MARPAGIEPTTFWSVVKRSIQLSYGRIYFNCAFVFRSVPIKYTITLKWLQALFLNFLNFFINIYKTPTSTICREGGGSETPLVFEMFRHERLPADILSR